MGKVPSLLKSEQVRVAGWNIRRLAASQCRSVSVNESSGQKNGRAQTATGGSGTERTTGDVYVVWERAFGRGQNEMKRKEIVAFHVMRG